MIFALDFTQISQTFIEQNIFVFTKVYCCNNLFIHNLFFFYAHYNHLPRRSAFLVLIQQILLYRHCLFHLSTYQQLICLNHHWISWIITKIKHLFITMKNIINIFSFHFMIKIIVSVNDNLEMLILLM